MTEKVLIVLLWTTKNNKMKIIKKLNKKMNKYIFIWQGSNLSHQDSVLLCGH